MLGAALQHPKLGTVNAEGKRAWTQSNNLQCPVRCATYIQKCVRLCPDRSAFVKAQPRTAYEPASGSGVGAFVKALNNEIQNCKTPQALQEHYSAYSPSYDAVCVSTVRWVPHTRDDGRAGTWEGDKRAGLAPTGVRWHLACS